MKTSPIIPPPLVSALAAIICLLAVLTVSAPAQVIVSYNFESLSNGALVGQDGWTSAGTASPVVANGSAGSVDTSRVAGNATVEGTAMAKRSFFNTNTLSTAMTLTLEVSVARTGSGGTNINVFGLGSSSVTPAYFGIAGNTFIIRGENFGTSYSATNLTADLGDWYTVRSVWDLSTGMASLYVKNLTDGDAGFTQLVFSGGVTSVSLGLTTSVANWTSGYVRLGQSSSSAGYLDDLSVTAVPEPSVALLAVPGLLLLVLRRKLKAA